MPRIAILIVVVLVGCKDKPAAPPTPKVEAGSGSAAMDPDQVKKCLDNPLLAGCENLPRDALLTPRPRTTADWTEQKGDGFVVRAPGPARIEKKTGTGADGSTFEATFYAGYGLDPNAHSIQVMINDVPRDSGMTDAELVAQMRDGYAQLCDAATVVKSDVTVGDVHGQELACTGSHAQLGAFRARARVLLRNGRLFVVQSMAKVGSAYYDGDPFVESFRFTP